MIRTIGLAACLVITCASAYAQRVPMNQDGTVHPGDVPKFTTNGRASSAGGLTGDANGLGTNPYSTTDRGDLGWCSNSAATGGAYQSACIGHDADGNAILAVDANNGAPQKRLKVRLNGTEYQWPGVGTGQGNVQGADTTVANDLAVWDNDIGSLLKSSGGYRVRHTDAQTGPIAPGAAALTVSSNAANNINAGYVWSCVNLTACDAAENPSYDVLRAVLTVNSDSTAPLVSGVSSYVVNNTARGGDIPTFDPRATAYNYIGELVSNADGAGSWNFNFLCTDSAGQVLNSNAARYCFNEIDYSLNSPNSQGIGLQFGGQSKAQPAYAAAVVLQHLDGYGEHGSGTTAKWTQFLQSADGSTFYFADIGAEKRFAKFTGTISGTTLTVTAVTQGALSVGAIVTGSSVAPNTTIAALSTGSGGIGTYTVSASQTVPSATLFANALTASQSLRFGAYNSVGDPINGLIQYTGFEELLLNSSTPTGSVRLMVHTEPVLTVTSNVVAINKGRLRLLPATWANNEPCAGGDMTADANYLYICTGTNTVKRVALSAF